MVEKRVGLEDELVGQVGGDGRADQQHLRRPERGREEDLAEVEAEGRAHVEVGIDMVHVVEAPERGPSVVQPVPVVEAEVEEQESSGESRRPGQRQHLEEARTFGRRPAQDVHRHRTDGEAGGEQGQRRDRRIDAQPRQQGAGRTAQRREALERKKGHPEPEEHGHHDRAGPRQDVLVTAR